MKRKKIIPLAVMFAFGVSLMTLPVFAQENAGDLKEQIKALQKRVEELESIQSKNMQQTAPYQQRRKNYNRFNRSWGDGWDPFEEMGRMQEEMNRLFQNSFSYSGSLGGGKRGMFKSNMFYEGDFDIQETKEGYVIKFDMRGLDKDKLNIEVNEHSITISGEQSSQEEESSQNGFYSSRSFGSFLKTVPLPVDADIEKMETKKEGSMLVIKMPKKK